MEKIDALDIWLAERARQSSSGLRGEANAARGGIDLEHIGIGASSGGLAVSLPGVLGKGFKGFRFRITGKRPLSSTDCLPASG